MIYYSPGCRQHYGGTSELSALLRNLSGPSVV